MTLPKSEQWEERNSLEVVKMEGSQMEKLETEDSQMEKLKIEDSQFEKLKTEDSQMEKQEMEDLQMEKHPGAVVKVDIAQMVGVNRVSYIQQSIIHS